MVPTNPMIVYADDLLDCTEVMWTIAPGADDYLEIASPTEQFHRTSMTFLSG